MKYVRPPTCVYMYIHVYLPHTAGGGESVSCQFDQDDCIVDYDVVLSGPFNTIGTVYVGEERGKQLHETSYQI